MTALIVTALIWVGLHIGLAGTRLRDPVARRLGDQGFRALFSVLSLAAIFVLARSYAAAPYRGLWVAPDWLRWLLVLAMLPAFALFAGAVLSRNPTSLGPPIGPEWQPRGMVRITRHPMLCSFALWALVHIIGTGDAASLIFFGAFGVTALAGTTSIDAKLARRQPVLWRTLVAGTSIVPFGAILAGRNHFAPRELGWSVPILALGLWGGMLILHPLLFGMSPLPHV